jgi:hypothetical protein
VKQNNGGERLLRSGYNSRTVGERDRNEIVEFVIHTNTYTVRQMFLK